MKYLAIFALLFLTGCDEARVGDCFLTGHTKYVVLEVGQYSLRARPTYDSEPVTFVGTKVPGYQIDCYDSFKPKETK